MSWDAARPGERGRTEKGKETRALRPPMARVSLACRGLGFACEWATTAPSAADAVTQFAQHAKCAHQLSELDPATRSKAEAAVRAAA